jgi:O-antigen ligase
VSAVSVSTTSDGLRSIARTAVVWLLIATLAWAPFPLGGAIAWAAGVQELLIAACWGLWLISRLGSEREGWQGIRVIAVPLSLAVLVLAWACVQIVPGVPAAWIHPVWNMASDALGKPVEGVISLNPWRTEAEIVKLSSYVMAAWLVFQLGRRPDTAKRILDAVILIGAAYALYAFVLELAGAVQTDIFYSVPWHSKLMSGPFMLHNSFATYSGLAMLAAIVRLFAMGNESIVAGRGPRRLLLSILHYCLGRGAFVLIAMLLTFAGVVASGSRAGFAATMCGLLALAIASLVITRQRSSRLWAGIGALAAALPLMVLITLNGDTLAGRVGPLLDGGSVDAIRLNLWAAGQRMIADAPWLGLGLGTFEDAYPLYASQIIPMVMDKAHCDYLEFAAGLGLPAAILWWTAVAWLAVLCLRGLRQRRRNRAYCLLAIGASVLVGVHSAVDFSLQLPSVSLLYATLMGLGVAQSTPTRRTAAN